MKNISFNKVLFSLSLVFLFNHCYSQVVSSDIQAYWLVGKWVNAKGNVVEEWKKDENGLIGQVYILENAADIDNPNAKVEVVEELQLTSLGGEKVYIAKTKDLIDPTPFTLMKEGAGELHFYNAETDYPKWIIYKKKEDGTLEIILKNEEKKKEFYFTKYSRKAK